MTAGIILAAGMSRRMGQAKMLLPWRGRPLVRHLAEMALVASLDPVVVVTGFEAAAVESALADLPLVIANNPRYTDGQSTSLLAGLAALPANAEAVVVLLVDQPLITPDIIKTLVVEQQQHPQQIVAPIFRGQRGNPVVFPSSVWPELRSLHGDTGARQILQAQPERLRLVEVVSDAVIADADTPEAYAALVQQAQS